MPVSWPLDMNCAQYWTPSRSPVHSRVLQPDAAVGVSSTKLPARYSLPWPGASHGRPGDRATLPSPLVMTVSAKQRLNVARTTTSLLPLSAALSLTVSWSAASPGWVAALAATPSFVCSAGPATWPMSLAWPRSTLTRWSSAVAPAAVTVTVEPAT
jgi:hypothetical protein